MEKSKVALLRCESYDPEDVYNVIKRGIDLIGGIDKFIKSNEKILIKPNILAGRSPEKATTTHPAVFEAVVRILNEKNVNITYGDSPGFDKPSVGLAKSGITTVAEKYNINQADFDGGKRVSYNEGVIAKSFVIANGVLDSDGIISLPKMKTHQLTRVTGAVKNQFGCVCGINKAGYHVTLPNATNFCKMLVELNKFLKPRFFIMDGILAMEGNGPASGNPVKMNCIIISSDPVAVDSIFCKLVDINPLFIPTNTYGKESGLGNYEIENIELLGDDINTFIKKDFDVIRKPLKEDLFLSKLQFLRQFFVSRPFINKMECIKCGICVESCPVEGKAVYFKNGRKEAPVYDYKKCIRCYCCQEVCPHKAIFVKVPLLGRLLSKR